MARIYLVGKHSDKYVEIDTENLPHIKQYNWNLNTSGYAIRTDRSNNKKKTVYMHREIMGSIPDGMIVDHINRNKLDNRRENLRICTTIQNAHNRKVPSNSITSKYKGVFYYGKDNLWSATITYNNKKMHLGRYEKETDAALAYDEAARKYYGEFAVLNFPSITIYNYNRKIKKRSTIYPGVYKIKNKIVAKYYKSGKNIVIGTFKNEEDAYVARQKYIQENS